MNSQSPCACAACAGAADGAAPRERPRYFPRQLLTPADMTQEQQYFRDKLRRHNRMMHGWGVVCGALVCPIPAAAGGVSPWKVQVSEGYVLGPYGDEILIDKVTPVDLRAGAAQGAEDDPWCSPVYTPPPTGACYVAVQYAETQARPVRVQPAGCGCDTSQCEYSRVRDGFSLGVLAALPKSYIPNAPAPELNQLVTGVLACPQCPQCPADPWVVLASVEYDADGTVTKIDNCTNRRMVLSLGGFWYRCICKGVVVIDPSPPIVMTAGQQQKDVTLTGSNFDPAIKVDLGPDFKVVIQSVSPTSIVMTITPAQNAAGAYPLRVINPDCSTAPPIGVTVKAAAT